MTGTLLFLGLGMQEILFIALIVLLFFGGKKIPELMKGLGKGVKSFKEGMNGVEDDFVPTVMGRQIYDACVSEKRLWLVDGAAHARSYYVAREEYEEKMLDFMEEHL